MKQFQVVEYTCNWNPRKVEEKEYKTILRNNDKNFSKYDENYKITDSKS